MDNDTKLKLAHQILNTLNRRKFADWYMRGRFDSYISVEFPEGDPRHVSQEDIIQDIIQMFQL